MKQYHEVLKGKTRTGTGAKKIKNRDKRLAHIGGFSSNTKLDSEDSRGRKRARGGTYRTKLKRALLINVSDGKTVKKDEIKKVLESNTPDLTRQNIIVKGTLVETKLHGLVKVTSRPGKHGVLNGIVFKKQ